jgi:hypothetical protein
VKSTFKITHSEELTKTLGFQFDRTNDGSVFMHQTKYIDEVLKRFGMTNCKPVSTPSDYHIGLCKTGAYIVNRERHPSTKNVIDKKSNEDIEVHKNNKPNSSYREVNGCLLWISLGTRPDITYAVNQCARYPSDPKTDHWVAGMRILQNLNGTRDYGLFYHRHMSQ